ncbi:MAG: 50S ribosomal protein L35 [Candidatus Moraniibacteriota bacterium]
MKQKTKKSVAKKIKVTGRKKLLHRGTGQNHYNSRDTGNATRAKRRDLGLSKTDTANIKRALPYA